MIAARLPVYKAEGSVRLHIIILIISWRKSFMSWKLSELFQYVGHVLVRAIAIIDRIGFIEVLYVLDRPFPPPVPPTTLQTVPENVRDAMCSFELPDARGVNGTTEERQAQWWALLRYALQRGVCYETVNNLDVELCFA